MKLSLLLKHVTVATLIAWVLGGILIAYLTTSSDTTFSNHVGFGIGRIARSYWYAPPLIGAVWTLVYQRFISSDSSAEKQP